MRHSRLAGFFMAIGVRAVLDLVSGGSSQRTGGAGEAPRRAGAPRRPGAGATLEPMPGDVAGGAGEAPARPARALPALALLAVGAVTMLVFESTATRIIGVLALFAFVVCGVFAIADPRWLGASPALGHGEDEIDRRA
jgi:hypothetical protein